jgi:2-dehydropantoate 2-reductase
MENPTRRARTTVAVIGLGSIGGVAAACLREAGNHDVVACARRPVDSLTLESPRGTLEGPMRTLTDPTDAEPVDWVLLCTKTHETASTAPWLARLCRASTRVAVLQNGIGHVERVAPFAGRATVLPTVVYYNGERLAADRVRLRHVGDFDLAVPDDAAGRDFARLLEGTSLRVSVTADFTTLVWCKLLMNLVANPITALTRQRQSVLRHADVRPLCLAVLTEAVAIARADGAHVGEHEPERILALMFSYSGELGTSMYFDTLAGRKLEVEALTGAAVAAGERYGIATPVNRTLLSLLRAISEAAGS